MKTLWQNLRLGFFITMNAAFMAASGSAQNLTVLHSFSNTEAPPSSSLIESADGTIYGMTGFGPATNNPGTIFKLATNGSPVTLALFSPTNNLMPFGGLAQANDGYFYGAASPSIDSGKFGTIFRMKADGTLTNLVYFNGTNGGLCYVPLTAGHDGNIYGTTMDPNITYSNLTNGIGWGTSKGGNGTVFKMTTNGILTTLFSFDGTNGSRPNGVIQGNDGNLYGTTLGGGDYNLGTVFRLTTNGLYTNLLSFDGTNGGNPIACIMQGPDGNLYGSTALMKGKQGSIFKLTLAGVMTTLVSFSRTNGSDPNASLIFGSDGNLYGTTAFGGNSAPPYIAGAGTIFRITPDGDFTTLLAFNGSNGGIPDQIPVLQARDGFFYGMTAYGGTSTNGVIYKMELFPKLLAVTKAVPASVGFTWSAQTNRSYQLQIRTNLNDTNWISTGPAILATGNTISTTNSADNTSSFFRVKLLP